VVWNGAEIWSGARGAGRARQRAGVGQGHQLGRIGWTRRDDWRPAADTSITKQGSQRIYTTFLKRSFGNLSSKNKIGTCSLQYKPDNCSTSMELQWLNQKTDAKNSPEKRDHISTYENVYNVLETEIGRK
jgi:hypothetical protein